MTDREMIDALWPRPVVDTDKDGVETTGEKILYYLKMIPWTIAALLFPVITHAVKTGVADLLPLAVQIATEQELGHLTGVEKAGNFNDQMKSAAISKGIELAASELNWLRENAVQVITGNK